MDGSRPAGRARPPADLLGPAELKAFGRRSDRAGWIQTLAHAGALTATGAAVVLAPQWWLLLPAMAVHGVVLIALFAPLHETAHRTVFAGRRPNLVLAQICGFLLLIPPVWFRHFHMGHHRHTQDPVRDPELARPKPTSMRRYLWHLTGLPTWRSLLVTIARLVRGDTAGMDYLPDHARADAVADARRHLAGYAAVAAGAVVLQVWLPVLLWLGPLVLAQPVLRAYLLAEHTGCATTPDLTRNTRTTLAGWLVRRLAWNMPYHAEHHLYPSVPFFRLPDLHRRIGPALGHVTPGYTAAHREIRATFGTAHDAA